LFISLAGSRPDLNTGAVDKEEDDGDNLRVEREEVEDELKDLHHLVKTRGYIAQLERENQGLRAGSNDAAADEGEEGKGITITANSGAVHRGVAKDQRVAEGGATGGGREGPELPGESMAAKRASFSG
jgi:hypothetical protein